VTAFRLSNLAMILKPLVEITFNSFFLISNMGFQNFTSHVFKGNCNPGWIIENIPLKIVSGHKKSKPSLSNINVNQHYNTDNITWPLCQVSQHEDGFQMTHACESELLSRLKLTIFTWDTARTQARFESYVLASVCSESTLHLSNEAL